MGIMGEVDTNVLRKWSNRDKCWMCKHRFEITVLLPVDKIQPGRLQPNISTEVLFHMKDTHGLPPRIVTVWLIGAIYNMELTLFGIRQ
jgi:hypothetical protein